MKITDWEAFRWLGARTGKFFVGISLLTVLQIISSLAGIFFALLCQRVIDQAAYGEIKDILKSGILLSAILLLQLGCYFITRIYGSLLEARLHISIQKRILCSILNGDYEKVTSYHTGSLMSRVQGDVRVVCGWLMSVVPGTIGMLVRLAGAFLVLCMLDMRFTLTMTAVCLVVASAACLYRKKIKEMTRQVQESGERLVGYYQELFSNLLVVRAFCAEKRMEERADQLLEKRYEIFRKKTFFGAAAGTGMRLAFQGAYSAGVVWCVIRISQGLMSYGTLTAVLQLLHQLQSPMSGLTGVMGQTWSMLVSVERLMELEDMGSTASIWIQEVKNPYFECIEAEELSFSYPDRKVLENVSFVIRRGDFILLKGQSGSGKTTLLKLLMGFYPQNALWLVTDQERRLLGRDTRELFTYVPQGNLLFSGTVKDNICCMCGERPAEERLLRAVKVSCVNEYLECLPDGLDTVVGERGYGLSEGQIQRIAIARALMSDAPVIILDEATSALDEELEIKILRNIRDIPGKTCLIASHRPAAEQFCEWIWNIDHGKIQRRQR